LGFVLSLLFVLPLFGFTIHALLVLSDWVDDAPHLYSTGPRASPHLAYAIWFHRVPQEILKTVLKGESRSQGTLPDNP
jgi:hypothetical protein